MYATMIKAYANFGNPKEAFVFLLKNAMWSESCVS
jgi:pentatricopeptide repeat protein